MEEGEWVRRRKPVYGYGADRVDVYSNSKIWEGTGTDVEGVWFPLEGTGDETTKKKRDIWDEKSDELSCGKEAMFIIAEPRHAYC